MNGRYRAALFYASRQWPIFRLTAYKTPLRNTHGHLDATCDVTTLQAWFDVPRPPNLGMACGRIVALDLDGLAWPTSKWGTSLMAAALANGGMPVTLTQRTARGLHLLFALPDGVTVRVRNEPRKKDAPGIDIKGEGGYIVLTPSVNFKTGFTYSWINTVKPAVMPQWLIDWCQTVGRDDKTILSADLGLGPRPVYLEHKRKPDQGIADQSYLSSVPTWSLEEESRIRAALAAIPNDCGHDQFLRIGLALHGLDWVRSDGSSISFDLFDEWCQKAAEYYNPAGLERKWADFERSSRREVTIGSLYHLAKSHGWNGQSAVGPPMVDKKRPPVLGAAGGGEAAAEFGESTTLAREVPTPQFPSTMFPTKVNGHSHALPDVILSPMSIRFLDTNEDGFPKATATNAAQAIAGLHVRCAKDLFHDKLTVAGQPIAQWGTDLTDEIIVMLRKTIRNTYGFDPGEQHARTGAMQLCLQNQFDPLLDFLDSLRWDGVRRIDTWMVDYMRAADTRLNRAIGRLVLVAAVRRARHPGCKFDQITVFESEEGRGKSTALEVLAGGPGFYSEQQVLGLGDREQQEASAGVWLHEIADLQGMRRSEIERVKAFASRKEDRARPAYGRFRVDKPRRCIYFATTNEEDYLRSDTGNRRFWPVRVGEVDLQGLLRDREQLWAEAAQAEEAGESTMLDRGLWRDARAEQEDRLEREPWTELIHNYVALAGKEKADVSVKEVLVDNQFIQMKPDALSQVAMNRAARALRALGFTKYRKRISGGGLEWRYRRQEATA